MDVSNGASAQAREKRKTMRRKRRRARRIALFLLIAVMVAVLVYVCLNVFFKVKSIIVEGNDRYGMDEIIVYSGIELETSLFSVDCDAVSEQLVTMLPYIEEANVSINPPSSVAVTVKEARAVARIAYAGREYLLSEKMKVLEQLADGADQASAAELPLITYPGVESCEISSAPEYDSIQIEEIIVDITRRLVDNNILGDVSIIDLSDPYMITLRYMDRFDVILGEYADFDYKFRYFMAIADERDKLESGTIDVSNTQRGFYRP